MKSKDQRLLEKAYLLINEREVRLNEESSSVMYCVLERTEVSAPEFLGLYSTAEKAESARSEYINNMSARAYDEKSRDLARRGYEEHVVVEVISVDKPCAKHFE